MHGLHSFAGNSQLDEESVLREMFDLMDTNQNGKVEASDFYSIVEGIGWTRQKGNLQRNI